MLPEKDLKELFYHGHFEIEEKTEESHQSFTNQQIEEFYQKNNQVVPFD